MINVGGFENELGIICFLFRNGIKTLEIGKYFG